MKTTQTIIHQKALENKDDLRIVINLYDVVNEKVVVPISLFDLFDLKSDN